MRFVEYPRIPRSLPEGIPLREARLLSRASFEMTEKIHGAHLSVSSDGERELLAKRTGFLDPGDDFYGANELLPDLGEKARELRCRLGAPITQVDVHGELFGGAYPHPDVEACPGARPVQAGAWYSPQVRFAAYDVVVWVRERGVPPRFLPAREARGLLEEAGFLTPPVLARGRLADLDLPLPERTRIPDILGLPPVEENPAEGVVLKAETDLLLPVGDTWVRPVLKRKRRAFDEERFKHNPTAPTTPNAAVDLAATRALLDTAISKTGPRDVEAALDLAAAEAVELARGLIDLGDASSSERERLRRRAHARLKAALTKDERKSLKRR